MKLNYEIPIGIRYTFEILMACNLFIFPMKKRGNAAARIVAGMLMELLLGYVIGQKFVASPASPLFYLFWAVFVVLAMPYVWFVCDVPYIKALYCVVFGFAIQHLSSEILAIVEILPGLSPYRSILYFPIYIGVYVVGYFQVVRKLVEYGTVEVIRKRAILPATVVLLITLVLSVTKRRTYTDDNLSLAIICQIYDILCCFFILWMQVVQKESLRWQKEADYIDYLWHSQKHNYEISKESIEIINRKCHDIKHQISALRSEGNDDAKKNFIKEIEDSIMIYDASLDTGNKVLNTVLMEKMLFCNEHNIAFTCIADASRLDFIDIFDLYALFGNALNNAIESVNKISEDEKRVVSLKVAAKDEFILIQTENYLDQPLTMENGLPVTTKDRNGYHGYGIKSIRTVAEKYGGCIKIDVGDGLFTLQILIPMSS